MRSTSDRWRLRDLQTDLQQHEVDLRDDGAVSRAVAEVRPQTVFHLAVYGAYPHQMGLQEMVLSNVTGTANLVQAAFRNGAEAFVNTGSSSEYGFQDHAPVESEPVAPNSDYAVTKASATLYCQYIARSLKVHLPTLRLYSVYGPYEEPGRLIPTLILRGLEGQLPPLVRPDIARDYVYVDDVLDAYLRVAEPPAAGTDVELGAVYNVGSGVQTTLADVVTLTRELMGIKAEPSWGSMGERVWDTSTWVSDSRKIQRALGWRTQHSLEQGFRETMQWFREHPDFIELYRKRMSKSQ